MCSPRSGERPVSTSSNPRTTIPARPISPFHRARDCHRLGGATRLVHSRLVSNAGDCGVLRRLGPRCAGPRITAARQKGGCVGGAQAAPLGDERPETGVDLVERNRIVFIAKPGWEQRLDHRLQDAQPPIGARTIGASIPTRSQSGVRTRGVLGLLASVVRRVVWRTRSVEYE